MRNNERVYCGLVVFLLINPGCSDPASNSPDAGGVDGGVPDAAVDAPVTTGPAHLLLTEMAVTFTDREFVEIFNPGSEAVDLTNYYLSDDHEYAMLPGAFAASPIYPNITADTDFIVKFPDGASIAPGEAQVIAFRYESFEMVFKTPPDYGILDAPFEAAMVVPHPMVAGANPQLQNGGEPLALFYWDGVSDLVQDVDLLQMGNATTEAYNRLSSKTGVQVDGPDADEFPSIYQPDGFTISIIEDGAPNGLSHKRIALEDGNEMRGGEGNGLFGDDETTEDVSRTWDNSATWSAVTPGLPHPNLRP